MMVLTELMDPTWTTCAPALGGLKMLTTCDLFVDAIHICTELGWVLETVHLNSLLIAPAMLEAAAEAGQAGSKETMVRVQTGRHAGMILMSGWYLALICFNTQQVCTCTHNARVPPAILHASDGWVHHPSPMCSCMW